MLTRRWYICSLFMKILLCRSKKENCVLHSKDNNFPQLHLDKRYTEHSRRPGMFSTEFQDKWPAKNEKRLQTVNIAHVLDAQPRATNINTCQHVNATYLITLHCVKCFISDIKLFLERQYHDIRLFYFTIAVVLDGCGSAWLFCAPGLRPRRVFSDQCDAGIEETEVPPGPAPSSFDQTTRRPFGCFATK